MAKLERRLPANVPGPLFVDDSCIDCGTCWTLAPATFEEAGGQARVFAQPEGSIRHRAFMALVSCPTSSIGTQEGGTADEVRAATRALPDPIADGIFACGYASPLSYGAQSYLLTRGAGNVLVDSPRAAALLLARLSDLGGVRTMILTHRDDVADHRRLREKLACERLLHEDDVDADTADVERKLTGRDPIVLDDDLTIIPVPGHTRGSVALLYRDVLFSGDHLWGEGERLGAGHDVCWHSWSEQTRSMERLLDFSFTWVLPGHGDRFRARDAAHMRAELEALVTRMKR
jgi:glyoxylase-like metal-dependent hydrolase (beta-lactamase superfamily II)/ferredoxin